MRRVLLFLFVAKSAFAAVKIDGPSEVSFFEAPPIRVTGLQPLIPVTIRVTQEPFTSQARFVPHANGVVDTTTSVANGTYNGVDPMGLFWSLEGNGTMQIPIRGTVDATIDVLDGKGQTIASRKIARRLIPDDVEVSELRRPQSTLVGRYYAHPGVKRPGVLVLTGSNGGIDERMAPFLVSHGFNVLAVAYYHFEGVPDDLIELPLEYFDSALEWLAQQSSVDAARIAIVGASKGAEAALLTASYFPARVRAVAAVVPSSVVWDGADARARFGGDPHFDAPGKSSWSLDGKPLPFVHKVVSAERMANRPAAYADMYELALDRDVDPDALIPVERIRVPIFLASAGDDIVWPSLRMARDIQKRAKNVELHEYALAGHGIAPPGYRVGFALGGTPSETARASSDAWARLVTFLERSLKFANRGSSQHDAR